MSCPAARRARRRGGAGTAINACHILSLAQSSPALNGRQRPSSQICVFFHKVCRYCHNSGQLKDLPFQSRTFSGRFLPGCDEHSWLSQTHGKLTILGGHRCVFCAVQLDSVCSVCCGHWPKSGRGLCRAQGLAKSAAGTLGLSSLTPRLWTAREGSSVFSESRTTLKPRLPPDERGRQVRR